MAAGKIPLFHPSLSFSLTCWWHTHAVLHNCWCLWTTLSCWHLWTCCPAWQIINQSWVCLSLCVSAVLTLSHHVPKAAKSRFSCRAQRGHTEGQNHLHTPALCFTAVRSLHFPFLLCSPERLAHKLNITHSGASSNDPTAFSRVSEQMHFPLIYSLLFPFYTCEIKKLMGKNFKDAYMFLLNAWLFKRMLQ